MKKLMLLFFIVLRMDLGFCDNITWDSPTLLSSLGQDASSPLIAIDELGNAIAVWIENGNLFSSNKPSGVNPWGTAVQITAANASSSPKLVVDLNVGDANLIWIEAGALNASTQPFGTGVWDTPTVVAAATVSNPQLAVDPNGDVVAVWETNPGIGSATKLLGVSWASAVILTVSSTGDTPQVAIGADNDTVVTVWQENIASIDTILASVTTLAVAWPASEVISDPLVNSILPTVAVNSSGEAIALWFTYEVISGSTTNIIVTSAFRVNAGPWDPPEIVSDTGKGVAFIPSTILIGFDGNDNALALWNISFEGSSLAVQSALSMTGSNGTWTTPLTLNDLDIYAYEIDLSVGFLGDSLVAYMYNDIVLEKIVIKAVEANTKANTFMWSTPIAISDDTLNSSFPQVVITNDLVDTTIIYGAAVWITFDGANSQVFASWGLGARVQPPTGLAVTEGTNDFGTFQETFYTITWNPSPSSNILEYEVSRNGILIDTVLATSTLETIDHNRLPASFTDVYSIVAIDDDRAQSQPATISHP